MGSYLHVKLAHWALAELNAQILILPHGKLRTGEGKCLAL